MKQNALMKTKETAPGRPGFEGLVASLRTLIRESRQQALRAVDVVQVHTCWAVGRHIVEFEQGGSERAEYGARLLPRLAERLTAEFGKGFDERNLRHMRGFFQTFPIWNALRTELSWTHYRTLLRVDAEELRAELVREQKMLAESTCGTGRKQGRKPKKRQP